MQYKLIHKENKTEHVIDQKQYDVLKKRNHLKAYSVEPITTESLKSKYVPEEVRSMKKAVPTDKTREKEEQKK